MSEYHLRGVAAFYSTGSPCTGHAGAKSYRETLDSDIFDADTTRARLDCESGINRYGSHCTCGLHERHG